MNNQITNINDFKKMRMEFFNGELLVSALDIINYIGEIKEAKDYWAKLKEKKRFNEICKVIKMDCGTGDWVDEDCVTLSGFFEIVIELESEKAGIVKKWLSELSSNILLGKRTKPKHEENNETKIIKMDKIKINNINNINNISIPFMHSFCMNI